MNSINNFLTIPITELFGESFGESPALPIVSQYFGKLLTSQPAELDLIRQLSKCTGDGPSLAILAHIYYMKSQNGDSEFEQNYREYYQKVEELDSYDGYLTLSLIYFIGSLTDSNIESDLKSLISKHMGNIDSYYDFMSSSLKILRDLYGFGLTREEKEEKAIKLLMRAYKLNKPKVAKIFKGICELKSTTIIEYLMTEHEKIVQEKDQEIETLKAENLELRYRPSCECGAEGGPGFLAAKEEFNELTK